MTASDRGRAYALAEENLSPEEVDRYIEWLQRRVTRILSDSIPRQLVEVVAKELLARKEMSGKELTATINEAVKALSDRLADGTQLLNKGAGNL